MSTVSARADQVLIEANRHHLAGRLAEAEAGYTDVLRLRPKDPDALHYLGVLRTQQKDYESAIKLIGRAIKARPNSAEMHVNLGTAYRRMGDATQAIYAYRKAIALQPDMAVAHFDLGHALRDAKNFDAAIVEYQTYLKDRPEDPPGLLGLGCAYVGLGRHDDAMTAFDLAITFDPQFAEGYNNIGTFLNERGRCHTALPFYEEAVALAPNIPEWTLDYAVALLRTEHFEDGWRLYESRCEREKKPIIRRPAPPVHWQGENLEDKSIIVWMEQGLGDEILFSSLLPDVMARARHCVIACEPRMVPIFARSFPFAEIMVNRNERRPTDLPKGLDYQIGAGSLGRYLRPDRASFPRHDGYLAADPNTTAAVRARYTALAQGRRIVGLSWRTRDVEENMGKSIDLINLAPILKVPGVMFVNLQYGDCRSELAAVKKQLGVDIVHDRAIDPLRDMDAFFAQVAAMDLVVTSSNTSAHVAGALNKPVWVLLPAAKGLLWYWFLKRSDSPWYPSARLIRPSDPDTLKPWHAQVAATAADLLRGWSSGTGAEHSVIAHAVQT